MYTWVVENKSLNVENLKNLEDQLETSLKHVRKNKVVVIYIITTVSSHLLEHYITDVILHLTFPAWTNSYQWIKRTTLEGMQVIKLFNLFFIELRSLIYTIAEKSYGSWK